MSKTLKELYNLAYVEKLVFQLAKVQKSFNQRNFIEAVFDDTWEKKELKARLRHITLCLGKFLPDDYSSSIKIMHKIAPSFDGFHGMFVPDFVELYGFEKTHWKTSLDALEEFTKYSSSELAIRPFILRDPERVMRRMLKWSKSKNHHVRRLSSEGCRPRLPWAISLPEFKKNPAPIIPILENLIFDNSTYVQRSVANNINDISKDNPDKAIKFSKKWMGQTEQGNWIIKHGLRTLLKSGNQKALEIIGYAQSVSCKNYQLIHSKNINIGGKLDFEFSFGLNKPENLRIEYCIYYLRKNNDYYKKVFKFREKNFELGELVLCGNHSFKRISTRKYYRGKHFLSIQVNGVEVAKESFFLS